MASPRAWQRMLSGRRLNLLDPSPLDIEIEDIAQGLSRVARWNGQTSGDWAFSVAQHSMLVEDLVGRLKPETQTKWLRAALLHDAPEYVVGDMITPFKSAIGPDYKDLENRLLAAVHLRFGLPAAIPRDIARDIKRADRAAAYLEATQLAGFAPSEAKRLFGDAVEGEEILLVPMEPDEAKTSFLLRFSALTE
ncbi:HD family hydrolase [Pelagibius sp. Alg239-R121]|uniref:HD family hydrolase n=1 Tax=Pelagibius sp. Alg239-R121 TaxID=2993448 RepID=UPI0024A78373|nr:HD family hydrolase [Pelagibius sp. Alg239-R121]